MAQINQDRYETLAARALGVKGAGIFGHAEDAIFAGFALDTNSPVEFWYSQRIYRYGIGVAVSGVSSARSGVQVRNTTADQLWIIDTVTMSAEAIADLSLWIGEDTTADFFPAALLASNLDTRIPGSAVQDLGSQGTNVLANPPGHGRIQHLQWPAYSAVTFHPGVVLGPGGSFIANNEQANATTRFGVWFHTRQAMPGELT